MPQSTKYKQLNKNYDDMAKTIASLARKYEKIKDKMDELDKDFGIMLNRLSLYIKNELWDEYSYKKHSFLLSTNEPIHKIKFYYQSDIKAAKEKYEESKEETEDFLQTEFNLLYNEDDISIDEINNNELKEYNNLLKFLQDNKYKTIFELNINPSQEKTIKKITNDSALIEEKYHYVQSRLQDTEQEYNGCMEEIIQHLQNDDKYDFNYETDEIVSIRDNNTMKWHLVYYHVTDLLKDAK